MAEDRVGQRVAIGIIAFLMIMCGIGIAVCLAMGFGAYLGDISLGVYSAHWGHGFSIMIPGLIGIFVACGCGCCNTRCAYITNSIFDSLGFMGLLGPIMFYLCLVAKDFILVGSILCTEGNNQFGLSAFANGTGKLISFYATNDCDRNKIIYTCGVALTCMWAFGAFLTIVHLALVCHMTYVMRDTTPGHIVYMPGKALMVMKNYPNQGYANQGYGVQSSQPQQDYPTKSGY